MWPEWFVMWLDTDFKRSSCDKRSSHWGYTTSLVVEIIKNYHYQMTKWLLRTSYVWINNVLPHPIISVRLRFQNAASRATSQNQMPWEIEVVSRSSLNESKCWKFVYSSWYSLWKGFLIAAMLILIKLLDIKEVENASSQKLIEWTFVFLWIYQFSLDKM